VDWQTGEAAITLARLEPLIMMRNLSAFWRCFVDNTASMLFIQTCRITRDAILGCRAGCNGHGLCSPSVSAWPHLVYNVVVVDRACMFDVADCRRLVRSQQFDELGKSPTMNGNRRYTMSINFNVFTTYLKNCRVGFLKILISHHATSGSQQLTFGLNVHSANDIDDIIDTKIERRMDITLLTETWHDADSVSLRWLRAESLQLIERFSPDGVNHYGVTIAASSGVHL
jgi:hypothetical protein